MGSTVKNGFDEAGISNAPATFSIPIGRKLRAEKCLIGALLREPFNLSQHIGRLNRQALENASENLAPAFLEILSQFNQYGNYSPLSIEQKTGIDISYYASNDSEIDLAWAVDQWWHEYSIWAEATALQHGISEIVMCDGALAMRAAVEDARNKYGLNGSEKNVSCANDFLEWGIDKLEGKEKKHKTTPHLFALLELIQAFEPGDYWILAARPSMGKTAAGLNLHSWWHDQGARGGFISLEMVGTRLMGRLLGIRHGINVRSDWSALDRQTVSRALTETASTDEKNKVVNNVFNISEIEAWAISAYYRGELEYLIVDYIGLIIPNGSKQNREREIGSISAVLMRLALRLNIPVVALSQLNRAVETRGGAKRPQLSDLRDSGSLEQDATGVIFIHRPEYYGILEDEDGNSLKGVAEWIVAKQRNGPVGTVKCAFTPIRGFRDIIDESKTPTQQPQDFTEPKSQSSDIPKADINFDIPF